MRSTRLFIGFFFYLPRFINASGGTSVGNHNRSSVGIGCCCRCDFPIIIGSWINCFGVHVPLLILVHGHVFTSSFNCTAQQLNSTFTKRLLVLFLRDLVVYVKHVINNLNFLCVCVFFFFFADSNNNNNKLNIERKHIYDALKCCLRHCISFNPPVWFRKN